MTREELIGAINHVLGEDVVTGMIESNISLPRILTTAIETIFLDDKFVPYLIEEVLREAGNRLKNKGYFEFGTWREFPDLKEM